MNRFSCTFTTRTRTRTLISSRRLHLLLLVLVFTIIGLDNYNCIVVSATKITWHAASSEDKGGNVDPRRDAKTAPRSQKYWDEHGIVRPDYAKTDDEIRREKRQQQAGSSSPFFGFWSRVLIFLLVGTVAGMGFGGYVVYNYGRSIFSSSGGERLGGGRNTGSNQQDDEFDYLSILWNWFRQAVVQFLQGGTGATHHHHHHHQGNNNNADSAFVFDEARQARLTRFEQTQQTNKAD